MSRIHLTIDHLALPPMPPADRKALLAALHTELCRALADPAARAAWASNHRTPVLRLGAMPLQPGPAAARAFGTRLAAAVARGLKP